MGGLLRGWRLSWKTSFRCWLKISDRMLLAIGSVVPCCDFIMHPILVITFQKIKKKQTQRFNFIQKENPNETNLLSNLFFLLRNAPPFSFRHANLFAGFSLASQYWDQEGGGTATILAAKYPSNQKKQFKTFIVVGRVFASGGGASLQTVEIFPRRPSSRGGCWYHYYWKHSVSISVTIFAVRHFQGTQSHSQKALQRDEIAQVGIASLGGGST